MYIFIVDCVATVYKIDGLSMSPTLLPGDWVLVSTSSSINSTSPQQFTSLLQSLRNSIVVMASPSIPDRLLVKRVHGLPGDIVESPTFSSMLGPAHYYIHKGHIWVQGQYKVYMPFH
jgi:signal peptidase I